MMIMMIMMTSRLNGLKPLKRLRLNGPKPLKCLRPPKRLRRNGLKPLKSQRLSMKIIGLILIGLECEWTQVVIQFLGMLVNKPGVSMVATVTKYIPTIRLLNAALNVTPTIRANHLIT